jgi:creatinine amidohydrolase
LKPKTLSLSMPQTLSAAGTIFLAVSISLAQGKLPVQWEKLTGPDFVKAIQQAQNTCLLPIGILEKHGPHLPIGTDLFNARYVAIHAAEREYSVVFPAYYFGQIFEARHQPGTVAYSAHMQLDLLQETTDEMARNGCKKILIVNGHGGNNHLLPYFAQIQLASPHDYVVYVLPLPKRVPVKDKVDAHAGESETSVTMVTRPDLVHLDRARNESGADLDRLHLPEGLYTGIWWYARFPNHYAGEGFLATKALGEEDLKNWVEATVTAIRAVKADQESFKLQKEFYQKAAHPLDTPQ